MIFSASEIATMVVAVVAGGYGLKGQRTASRATTEAAKVTAAANVRVAELQAESERLKLELERQKQVHDEASGIWQDAAKWREEQGRIIAGLRAELAGERERSQARERELVARIEALEKWKSAMQPQIDLACDVEPCERRRRPRK